MRLFKKTAALVMVFMMLVTAMSSFTLASANAVVDKFEVKEFSVLNSTGGNTLAAGDVTVNVTLQRVKGDNNTTDVASVIAAVYSNGALVDVAASKKAYPFTGTTQVNEMNLTIPTGTVEPELKVFLWNGDMITPIAKPSDEAKITSIKVGDTALSLVDGTNAYTVNADMNAPAQPKIKVAANGLVKATVAWSGNVATVTAGDETYTITYNKAQPTLVASYSGATDYNGGKTWSERQVLQEASATITGAADDKKLSDIITLSLPGYGADNMPAQREEFKKIENYASRLYSDTWSLFWDVPDALVGKTRVVYDYYNGISWNNLNAGNNAYYWTITIDADTRIWYSSRMYGNIAGLTDAQGTAITNWSSNSIHYLGADGVIGGTDDVVITPTITTYGNDFKFINEGRAASGTTNTFATLKESGITTLTEGPETNNVGYHYIFTADLTLPEGATTATYIIGGHKDDKRPAILCYEFINNSAAADLVPPTITNATYSVNATGAKEDLVLKGPTASPTAEQLGDTSRTIKDIFGMTSFTDIDKYFTPTTSNRYPYWFMLDLPQKYVGKYQMLAGYAAGGQAEFSQEDLLTFTTDKNMRVYYSSWPNWVDVGAKDEGEMTVHLVTPGNGEAITKTYDDLKASAVSGNKAFTYHMYSYDIIVPEGEDTVTVRLKTRTPANWAFPAIFYEAIE